MTRFVLLLRGVNVGRGNRVPMGELRALLESLGYTRVKTLLNSGNAVFEAEGGSSRSHAERIRAGLAARIGVDVPVVVKSAKELAAIESGNPLSDAVSDASRLLVIFTSDSKAFGALRPIAALVREPELWHIGRHAAYLLCPAGILESKAAKALLGAAGKAATTRNWATVTKLVALSQRQDDD